jgi:hypothetical protein
MHTGVGALLVTCAAVIVATIEGAVASAQSSAPPRAADHTVKGIVTDTAGQPIAGVEIVLTSAADGARTTRSGSDGRFELRGLRAARAVVRARRLGYAADTLRLRTDDVRPLALVLRVVAADIDAIVVTGRGDESNARLTEFYEHKRLKNRFGYFFERAEIERRGPTHLSELLRQLRGVHLSPSGGIGNKVLLRGCRPMVWLNGLRVPDAEVDEVAHPDEVAGLEVYTSMVGMPARFVDMVGKCGAVVIWTR